MSDLGHEFAGNRANVSLNLMRQSGPTLKHRTQLQECIEKLIPGHPGSRTRSTRPPNARAGSISAAKIISTTRDNLILQRRQITYTSSPTFSRIQTLNARDL